MQSKVFRSPGLANGLARALVKYSMERDASLAECLQNTGIPVDQFDSREWNIALEQEIQLSRNLLARFPEHPCFLGYSVGLASDLNIYGLIGQSILCCENAGEALRIISRYTSQATHPVRIQLRNLGSSTRICYSLKIAVEKPVAQFMISREMGLSLAVYRMINKQQQRFIEEIGLRFPDAAPAANALSELDCPFNPEASEHYFQISNEALQMRMLFGDRTLGKLIEDHVYERMRQTAPSLTDEASDQTLQAQIIRLLKTNGLLSRDDVAKKLFMSPRSLSRRLQEEDICWRTLLARYRLDAACQLLRDTELPLEKIAAEVGYSSASALSNAFLLHMGCGPSRFRSR